MRLFSTALLHWEQYSCTSVNPNHISAPSNVLYFVLRWDHFEPWSDKQSWWPSAFGSYEPFILMQTFLLAQRLHRDLEELDINHPRYFLYFLHKVSQSSVLFYKNVYQAFPQVVVFVVVSLQFLSQDHHCCSRSVLWSERKISIILLSPLLFTFIQQEG
jgi:hypothetical protein